MTSPSIVPALLRLIVRNVFKQRVECYGKRFFVVTRSKKYNSKTALVATSADSVPSPYLVRITIASSHWNYFRKSSMEEVLK